MNNSTPLMAAAKTGAADTVRLLMSKGADPTVKDVDGRTAVFNGIGHNAIIEILLQVCYHSAHAHSRRRDEVRF